MSNTPIPENQSDYPSPPRSEDDQWRMRKKRKSKKSIVKLFIYKYAPFMISILIILGIVIIVINRLGKIKDQRQQEIDASSNIQTGNTPDQSQNSSDTALSGDDNTYVQNENNQILYIDPLPEDKLVLSRYDEVSTNINNAIIDQMHGSIMADDQEDSYSFTPEIDGIYRFEFSDIPNDVSHSLYLYNMDQEELYRNTNIGNGNGITAQLNAGKTYNIVVKKGWNTGSYTLNMGHQKPSIEASEYTQILDAIQYTDQENDYYYVPDCDGLYRFEFSDIPNNISHSMYVYNSQYEELDRNTNIGNGNGITISLNRGQEYHIVVKQSWNIGSYRLNIGKPKSPVNITDYSKVSDSIQYTDQENTYEFTPDLEGIYRFEFDNIPNNVTHSIYVYNSNHEELDRHTGIGNGDGITIKLNSGDLYYICITQYWNTGSYDLLLGKQKEYVDITAYKTISDSIQFTDQENRYVYTSPKDGNLTLSFSNLSDNASLSFIIYNFQWEEIDEFSGFDNDYMIELSLEYESIYYFVVKQNWNYCNYTFEMD